MTAKGGLVARLDLRRRCVLIVLAMAFDWGKAAASRRTPKVLGAEFGWHASGGTRKFPPARPLKNDRWRLR
jgi:hypothetical protein